MAAREEQMVRIGELSRRVGVSAELLRAWERRYELLCPTRTAGGFRLYSADDERRVRRMQELLAGGLSAAEAASAALAEPEPDARSERRWEADARLLRASLDRFDEQGAHVAFDRLLAAVTVETLLGQVVIPYLHELGRRWEAGEATVGQEHFASHVLRGRLLGLARGWDRGSGPRVILATAPGELHDLPLIVFGLALRGLGWRITFLGADTPVDTVLDAADRLEPRLVVVSAVDPKRLDVAAEALEALGARHSLALAGSPGVAGVAERIGAAHLRGDPVAAAEGVVATL